MEAALLTRGPLCMGLDPSSQVLSGWDLPDTAAGARELCLTCIDAVRGVVGIVKPQSAFFERFGSAGVAVLEDVCAAATDAGLVVILDAKRGDIGTTSAAYAQAYLSADGPFATDALTVSPYLGFESLRPMLDAAATSGRGVFVLASTSNPEAVDLQAAKLADGATIQQDMWARAFAENARVIALTASDPQPARFGPVGLVVGATIDRERLPLTAFNGFLLAPGLGAQGATAADIANLFSECRESVVPSSSRDVLMAGPTPARIAEKAAAVNDELRQALQG
jgi:orotidine-5'-phosphate decarboxylase